MRTALLPSSWSSDSFDLSISCYKHELQEWQVQVGMKQIIPEWNEAETGKQPRHQSELFRKNNSNNNNNFCSYHSK